MSAIKGGGVWNFILYILLYEIYTISVHRVLRIHSGDSRRDRSGNLFKGSTPVFGKYLPKKTGVDPLHSLDGSPRNMEHGAMALFIYNFEAPQDLISKHESRPSKLS